MDIDKLITEALDKVNKEIEKSRIGKDTDRELPIAMLLNIKLELTKMLEILDNLNSAVFFLVRKFYMLRCLFGTLYVDMRCFGVSCFFLSIKSPTQTNGEY